MSPEVMGDELAKLFSLEGETAVIADQHGTGGLETAELLLSAGARVILLDDDRDALGRADRKLADRALFRTAKVDIRDEAAVCAFFRDLSDDGGVDILVNIAGLFSNQPFIETTAAQWEALQALNLWSPFVCMREALRLMLAQGRGGRIVNVTTVATVVPALIGNGAYSASRAGVASMSRSAALDHAGDGIRINCVLPGAIEGKVRLAEEMIARPGLEIKGPANDPKRLPGGKGALADVAAAVLFLVAPASRYINGQSLALDGGFLLS